MQAVERGAREEWVGLFAGDAVLEDPVGDSPALQGRDAIAAFWDGGIAALDSVHFDVSRVHETTKEAAVLADVTIRAGSASARYDAVIVYQLDEAGKIVSLRAFWDQRDVMAQLVGE